MDNVENGKTREKESITLYFKKDGYVSFITISKTEDTNLRCIKKYRIKLYTNGMLLRRQVYIDGLDFWEKLQNMPYQSIEDRKPYMYNKFNNYDQERFMYVLLGSEYLSVENLQEGSESTKYIGAILVGDDGQYKVDKKKETEAAIQHIEANTHPDFVEMVDKIVYEARSSMIKTPEENKGVEH